MLGIVLALMFALPVMTTPSSRYPSYMALFAFCGGAWFVWLAWQARAAVGLLLLPVALLWLNPLLGGTWFTRQGAPFFLAHSAIALLFGIGAYTYAATEKPGKP
jgi:hypothetical protein